MKKSVVALLAVIALAVVTIAAVLVVNLVSGDDSPEYTEDQRFEAGFACAQTGLIERNDPARWDECVSSWLKNNY